MPGSALPRRLLAIGALALAVGLLVLGALYQADTGAPAEVVGSGEGFPANVSTQSDDEAAASNPVQGFLPRSGLGSTCTEPVGIDLIPGYAASLIINGVPIEGELLNDPGSAGSSLNQYTYGPEADCPNGLLLRPQENVVQACVWRIGEAPDSCRTYTFAFDAL